MQLAQVRQDKESAIDSQTSSRPGRCATAKGQLLAGKTARQQQWQAAHPDLASLAEQVQRLSGEVEWLQDLLGQHGIETRRLAVPVPLPTAIDAAGAGNKNGVPPAGRRR